MNTINVILSIVILIIVPAILGMLITFFCKTNEKNNLLFSFVVGYLMEFATFELIYLPMYFFDCSFKLLQYVWTFLIIALVILSLLINRKRIKEIFSITWKKMTSLPYTFLIVLLLILLQIYVPVTYRQRVDSDDAFYLATTNTTIQTNSLFKYNGYDGVKYEKRDLRYSMSGLVIYYAVLSEIIGIHPAILEHTILPIIIIPLEFMVYALIGNKLLKKNKEKLAHFLILLSLIHVLGFISIFTNFTFFACRSWQGKSLLANFIIPVTWLIYTLCIENNKKLAYWIIFLLIMCASCFVTQMGTYLVPIEVRNFKHHYIHAR